MKWQEFEDKLKENVRRHETPVDTEALWERLQPPKKRRRILLLWWWPLGLLLAGGLAGVWQYRSRPLQHDTLPPVAVGKAAATQPSATTPVAQPPAGRSTWPYRPTSPDATYAQSGNNPASIINTGSEAATRNVPADQASTKVQSFPTEAIDNQLIVVNSDSTSIDLPVAASVTLNPPPAVLPDTATTGYDRSFGMLLPLPMIQSSLPPAPTPVVSPIDCRPKRHWWLGLTVGASYRATHRVHMDSLPDGIEIPKLSRQGERTLEALELGLMAQTRLGGGWSLRSGLVYHRMNSVFEWEKTTVEQRSKPALNYYINGNVDTTNAGHTFVQIRRSVRHYNRITFFSLPVELRRGFAVGRGSVAPFVGGQLQWGQQATGIIDSSGIPNRQVYRSLYRRPLSFALRGGVALNWPLGRHTMLSVEPQGVIDLSSRTQRGYAPAERFRQFGVRVGIWRRF